MTYDQFRIIRGFLLTLVILVGFIAGILLALAWEYESSRNAYIAHAGTIDEDIGVKNE